MKRLKKSYIIIIALLVLTVTFFGASYAYFTSKNEEHGKLNIVAGELKYKIESTSLKNNQLTLAANETKDLELKITSLNEIDSKYELYYTSTSDISVYYDSNYELPKGTITAKETKTLKIQIINNLDSEATVIFSAQGGLVNHILSLNQGNKIDTAIPACQYVAGEVVGTFDYTGSEQEFIAKCNGIYKIELWGAGGGTIDDREEDFLGKGGYVAGEISLEENTQLHVYVGEKGTEGTRGDGNGKAGIGASATFNGGGAGGIGGIGTTAYPSNNYVGGPSGGGATDIRLVGGTWNNFDSLKSRIMVAGGGGGYMYTTNSAFISGGNNYGLIGQDGSGIGIYSNTDWSNKRGIGGKQTSGYAFGYGGKGDNTGDTTGLCNGHAGGGGGYYGGTGGLNTGGHCFIIGGGAGSSFISGHSGSNAIAQSSTASNIVHTNSSIHYSGYIFKNTKVIEGTNQLPTHDGKSTMIGNNGNGYAKITYLGENESYSIGDAVTLTDGSRWHVLEESSEESPYVTLLSDYNLNSDGTYNYGCGRDINSAYKCSPMAFDSDDNGLYDENNSNNIGYFIKNIYKPIVTTSFPGIINVTLPTAEQIAKADNKEFNQAALSLSSSWLLTTDYWTKTQSNDYPICAFDVYSSSSNRISAHGASLSTVFGVRPTITVPKKYIVNTMTSNTKLTVGTAVEAIDGSKWHVLEESNSDNKYVTLLSDYNLNNDGSYNIACGLNINSNSACSPIMFDANNTTKYDENDSNNIAYFIKNTYAPLVQQSLRGTTNVKIPSVWQLAAADGKSVIFNTNAFTQITNTWLVTTSYWTVENSSQISNLVYNIYGDGSRFNHAAPNHPSGFGARPVITTLKTNLLAK